MIDKHQVIHNSDLQEYVNLFHYTIYHMQYFLFQPNTNQFISSTLQTNISEAREYFLQKKANSSDKRYMKTRAKSWTSLDMNTQQI